jgi:hypothetical protein
MIRPEEIRRKAENLYPQFLCAWLEEKMFFPRSIPARRRPDNTLAAAIDGVHRLRAGAKETLGYGYTVQWKEINSRKHGRNLFPNRILFETQDDFLRYIGKLSEFAAFTAAVENIRSRYPELLPWIRSNRKLVVETADDVEGLLMVVDYLRETPRPGLFARELPLPLDTKFIERNQPILRDWLDILLPPAAIHSHEEHFERRYGLRSAEPHILVRFLDPDLQKMCGSPWPECSIPLYTLAEIQVPDCRVLIVENKVNLLTLPPLAGSLAMGGLGAGVTELQFLSWLSRVATWYWGDLDIEGIAILSRLRKAFPRIRSLLMDDAFLDRWKALATPGTGSTITTPANLTKAESAAFAICAQGNLRIEQEHVPHWFVLKVLQDTFETSASEMEK